MENINNNLSFLLHAYFEVYKLVYFNKMGIHILRMMNCVCLCIIINIQVQQGAASPQPATKTQE